MSLQPIKGEKSLFILQAVIASPVEGRTDSLAVVRVFSCTPVSSGKTRGAHFRDSLTHLSSLLSSID